MRFAVLVIAATFTAFIVALTVDDIVKNGLNVLDLVAGLVIALFAIGIIGALIHRRDQ